MSKPYSNVPSRREIVPRLFQHWKCLARQSPCRILTQRTQAFLTCRVLLDFCLKFSTVMLTLRTIQGAEVLSFSLSRPFHPRGTGGLERALLIMIRKTQSPQGAKSKLKMIKKKLCPTPDFNRSSSRPTTYSYCILGTASLPL